ncbi:MAG: type II toxin-antitoxin system RelE/ParE family toxin [Specibacter sp.]
MATRRTSSQPRSSWSWSRWNPWRRGTRKNGHHPSGDGRLAEVQSKGLCLYHPRGDEGLLVKVDFATEDLRRLYTDPNFRLPRIATEVVRAYQKKVTLLVAAGKLRNFKSLHLEKLVGDRAGDHSIRLNKKWRIILHFRSDENGQQVLVLELSDHYK